MKLQGMLRGSQSHEQPGNLEYLWESSSIVVACGWSTAGELEAAVGIDAQVSRYERPDVSIALGSSPLERVGFLLVAKSNPNETIESLRDSVQKGLLAQGIGGISAGKNHFFDEAGIAVELLREALESQIIAEGQGPRRPQLRRLLADLFPQSDVDPTRPGDLWIDYAISFEVTGTLVIGGWGPRDAAFVVDGERIPQDCVYWFPRPDVVSTVGSGFAGFVAVHSGREDSTKSQATTFLLEASSADTAVTFVPERMSDKAPVQVGRRIFDIPLHSRHFQGLLDAGVGSMLTGLISAEGKAKIEPGSFITLDSAGEEPLISVVIPLYGRFDLLWNQFASWAGSTHRDKIQLVLVNDDPIRGAGVLDLVEQINSIFSLPVTYVEKTENTGFADTCNTGAQCARAPFTLFLNSDAFLTNPDTVTAAVDILRNDDSIGVVGAVIFGPDGQVSHSGMDVVYLSTRSSWFNYHPQAGLNQDSLPSEQFWSSPAVTGAVMLVRTEQFLDLGGLSTDYLIGDYEDSDLCWKYRESGFDIVVSKALASVHMERTSISLIGSESFRERLSLFNSWIHAQKWSEKRGFVKASEDSR